MLYFARWKTILIWATVLLGLVLALPNVLPQRVVDLYPSWMPQRTMTLGLDLQGGSYILLEVDRPSLVAGRLQTLADDVRTNFRTSRIGYTALAETESGISVRLRDPAQADAARESIQILTDPVSGGLLGGGSITEVELAEPQPGVFQLNLTEAGINYRLSTAVEQSIEVVRRRVDELGTTEPVIQRQGTDRIMVQVPGLQDPERLKSLLNQTAQLNFRLVELSANAADVASGGARAPASSELLYIVGDTPEAQGEPILVQRQVMVSGENLTDAQAGFDQQTNEAVVNIRFDSQGAQRFGSVTQENVGRPFAIVLDDQVLSAPNIREPILGGQAQISGSFTAETANDLAVLLRAGALPANLDIIEERTVGPGLGADSIEAGQIASIVGAVLVVAFMFLAYGFLGLLANIALAINVILLVALLTLLGATLTLPGIAGIVLTMGMAVDSNVLIYERVLDERRTGKSVIQSFDIGLTKALGTIMDSNITILIAAAALFFLGTGPVRGFAVTLGLGVFTTIFSGIVLTRWLVSYWVKRQRPKEVPGGWIAIPRDIKGRYMAVRNWAFTITAALSIAALAGFATVGMNYGIDFTGGTVVELRAKGEAADVAQIREDVGAIVAGDVQVQEFGSARDVIVRFGAAEVGAETQATIETIRAELQDEYDFQRIEVVGPTVSSELAWAAFIGVGGALFGILVYIWLRFEWQFAIGAILATMHDVVMTLGFLVVTQIEFNLSTIAAILTIVGYSLNDTVVVFDRIRENLRKFKKMPIADVIDKSLDETTPRTIITVVTVILALLALFAFGGEVIRNFVAPLLVGVLVGIYSSIYIAAPILIFFKLRGDQMPGATDDAPAASRASRLPTPAGKA